MPDECTPQKKRNLEGAVVFFGFFFSSLCCHSELGTENIGGTKKGMWETSYTVGGKNPQHGGREFSGRMTSVITWATVTQGA